MSNDQAVVTDPPTDPQVIAPVVPSDDNAVVPKRAYEEVASDLQKRKARERELEQKLRDAEARENEQKLKALREKEDYKSMYETEKASREKFENELTSTRQSVIDSAKWNSASRELLAIGLDPATIRDVERLVDLDEIEVELTSTGRVNVLNAKEVAAKFKAKSPYYFQNTSKPNLNPTIPTVISPTTVTLEAVTAAEKEFYKNRTPENERKYKELVLAYKAKH